MEVQAIRKDKKVIMPDGTEAMIPCLVPAYKAQWDEWTKLKQGQILSVNVKLSRKIEHHNQFFAILMFTYENLPEEYGAIRSFDIFRAWLMLEIGWVNAFKQGGEIRQVPKSISFSDVDQVEFMANVYLPGIRKCADILGMTFDEVLAASEEFRHKKQLYSSRTE